MNRHVYTIAFAGEAHGDTWRRICHQCSEATQDYVEDCAEPDATRAFDIPKVVVVVKS